MDYTMRKFKLFIYVLGISLSVGLFQDIGLAVELVDKGLPDDNKEVSIESNAAHSANIPTEAKPSMPPWMQNAIEGKKVDENIIREGDLLEIHVYPQEDLSAAKTVDKEGKIFFPFLGRVKASGFTLPELEQELTVALKDKYLENPRILIEKQSSSLERWMGWWKEAIIKPINIIGEVHYQGTYFVPRDDVTLIEAVSTREGFTKDADLHRIKIIRKEGEKDITLIIDAKDILDAKIPDTILKRGDIVIVPRRERATISVMGEVNIPKPITIYEDSGMSLMEAITQNTGFTRAADANAVRISRVVEGKQISFIARGGDIMQGKVPDVPLQNGDIVFVPQGGKLIHIFGEVRSPGPLNISLYGDKLTLIEAISLAGDFTRIAAKNNVRIIRVVDGKPRTIQVKAGNILKGKEDDFILEAGDVVVVPEAFW